MVEVFEARIWERKRPGPLPKMIDGRSFCGSCTGNRNGRVPSLRLYIIEVFGAHLWGAVTAGLPRPGDTWTKFLKLVYGNGNGHATKYGFSGEGQARVTCTFWYFP